MLQKEESADRESIERLPFVVLAKAKREVKIFLPYELYQLIFRYLPALQVPKLALVNKAFNRAKQRFFSEYEVRARQTFHERQPDTSRIDDLMRVHSVKIDTEKTWGFYFATQLALTDLDTRGPIACAINDSVAIVVYDYQSGKILCKFQNHENEITAITALSRHRVISSDKKGEIYAWPLPQPKKLTGIKKLSRAAKEVSVVQQEYSYKLDSKVASLERIDGETFMAATHDAIHIFSVSQSAPIKTIASSIPLNMARFVSPDEIYLLSHLTGEYNEYQPDWVDPVPVVIRLNNPPQWCKEVSWFSGIPTMDCFGAISNCHMAQTQNGQVILLVNGYRDLFSFNENRPRSHDSVYNFKQLDEGVRFFTRQGRIANIAYKKNSCEFRLYDPRDIDYAVLKK